MTALDLSQRHILLVDDEVFSRDTVAHIIRSIGQPTLYQAGDGIEALALLREHDNIDLVICDFKMPKMNGLGLLHAIRNGEAPVPRATMFAMLTGYSEKSLVHAALALDVNAFLIKPVSKKMLIDRFQRMFTASADTDWIKPTGAYADIDTHIPSIDPSASRESVFDKVAEQEFASARLAQALNRKRAAASSGAGQSESQAAARKGGGRFSALRGKFTDSDLAGHIADGVERLADDMGRDHAIKVIDHLDGLQKRGLMSLNDVAETLSNPDGLAEGPAAITPSDAKMVERIVALSDIPDGTALSRDIQTADGAPLIQGGIALTNMVRAILTHLHDLQLLELPKDGDAPGAYVRIAEDYGAARPPRKTYSGPAKRVHVQDLKEGDLLARHIYTEDGRMYMQAGSELSARLISLLKDLCELETISPEVWVQG